MQLSTSLYSSYRLLSPPSKKRVRHLFTVGTETPTPREIEVFVSPSADRSTMCARTTSPCGAVVDLVKCTNVLRSKSVRIISRFLGLAMVPVPPLHDGDTISYNTKNSNQLLGQNTRALRAAAKRWGSMAGLVSAEPFELIRDGVPRFLVKDELSNNA